MEIKIQFISNPFLNTTREHEGWRLINKIVSIEDGYFEDISIDEIPQNCYREAKIINSNIEFGEVIYVQSKKSFLAQFTTIINTSEFSDCDDCILLANVIELRNKKQSYVQLDKIIKPKIISELKDLVGISSTDNGKVIVHVDRQGVIVADVLNNTECGYRLNSPGGIYECFEKLRSEGFPVMYHNNKTKLLTKISDLENFCSTLNCNLLLNNTEDSMMWQIVDANGIKFDFKQFLNEKGYEFYLF